MLKVAWRNAGLAPEKKKPGGDTGLFHVATEGINRKTYGNPPPPGVCWLICCCDWVGVA